jgi:DNA-binding transcriptional regulator YhcF (GntR family)
MPHATLVEAKATRTAVSASSSVASAGEAWAAYRRAAASSLGLAGGTVARAYRELESDGLVTTHGRHGTVVAGPPREPASSSSHSG